MKPAKILTALAAAALAVSTLTVPAQATTIGEGEGCTPGFWKNNTGAWIDPPLIDSAKPLGDLFYLAKYPELDSSTMLEALSFHGGRGFEGKVRILLRAATASWLNAAVEISFPERRKSIADDVNAAIRSRDAGQVIALADYYDGLNNMECPLDADEARR